MTHPMSTLPSSFYPLRQWVLTGLGTLLLLLGHVPAQAQQFYPVVARFTQLPPYPVYLADFSNPSQTNLSIQVQQNDREIATRPFRIRIYIEGQGFQIQSADLVQGEPPLTLSFGQVYNLPAEQVANYFKQYNLKVSAAQYARPFSEGAFRFGVEIIDFATNRPISGIQWANPVWITINEPPVWVMPQNALTMVPTLPQNIVFQWSPRHTNVSDVEYEFTITDLIVNSGFTGNVQNLFLGQPPYYKTRTRATTLVYDPTMPPLVPGRTYAYRVEAIAKRGREDVGVFRNNGFSEIQYFNYGNPLRAPYSLKADWAADDKQALFSWSGYPEHKSYLIEYAEKGSNTWQSVPVTNPALTTYVFNNLSPARNYQLRIYGVNDKNERVLSSVVDLNSNDLAAYVKADGVKKDDNDYKGTAKTDNTGLKKQDPTCDKPGLSIESSTSYEPKPADVLLAGNFQFLNAGEKKGVLQWSVPFAETLGLPVKKVNIWAELDDKASFNAKKELKDGTIKVTYNAEKLKELKRVSDKIPFEDLMGDGIGKQLDSVNTKLNDYVSKGQSLGRNLMSATDLEGKWKKYKGNLDTLNKLYALKDSLLTKGITNLKKKVSGDKKDDKKDDKKGGKKDDKKDDKKAVAAADDKKKNVDAPSDKKDDKKDVAAPDDKKKNDKKEEKKEEELTREAKEKLKEKIAALDVRLTDVKRDKQHASKLQKFVDDASESFEKEKKAFDPKKALQEGYLTAYPDKLKKAFGNNPKEGAYKIFKEIFNQFYSGSMTVGGTRISLN